MSVALDLHYREYGTRQDGQPVVLFLHGLLGSSINWQRIAKKIAETATAYVVVPDLRNHGASPHDNDVSYTAMAEDIRALMRRLAIPSADFVGHSMGGKLAMLLALTSPDLLKHLVVVDISPVTYQHDFSEVFQPLLNIPLDQIKNRVDADSVLAEDIKSRAIRDHLLQNLSKTGGTWHWRVNLRALSQGVADIQGFPDTGVASYTQPCVFIRGALSDYVQADYYDQIHQYFPDNQIKEIPEAGHWVYSEKPQQFLTLLEAVLKA